MAALGDRNGVHACVIHLETLSEKTEEKAERRSNGSSACSVAAFVVAGDLRQKWERVEDLRRNKRARGLRVCVVAPRASRSRLCLP
eukprot:6210041-Pleurochrysis_carterae.AAC.2